MSFQGVSVRNVCVAGVCKLLSDGIAYSREMGLH